MADDISKKLNAGMKAMDEGDFKKAYNSFKKSSKTSNGFLFFSLEFFFKKYTKYGFFASAVNFKNGLCFCTTCGINAGLIFAFSYIISFNSFPF